MRMRAKRDKAVSIQISETMCTHDLPPSSVLLDLDWEFFDWQVFLTLRAACKATLRMSNDLIAKFGTTALSTGEWLRLLQIDDMWQTYQLWSVRDPSSKEPFDTSAMLSSILLEPPDDAEIGYILINPDASVEYMFHLMLVVEYAWRLDSPLCALRYGLRNDGTGCIEKSTELKDYIVDDLIRNRLHLVNASLRLGCMDASHLDAFIDQMSLSVLLELFAGRLADHIAVCIIYAAAKINKHGLLMRQLVAEYRNWDGAYPHLSFHQVFICTDAPSMDIIYFYNNVFLHFISQQPAPLYSALYNWMPVGWRQATAPNGRLYYYNKASGETTWSRP